MDSIFFLILIIILLMIFFPEYVTVLNFIEPFSKKPEFVIRDKKLVITDIKESDFTLEGKDLNEFTSYITYKDSLFQWKNKPEEANVLDSYFLSSGKVYVPLEKYARSKNKNYYWSENLKKLIDYELQSFNINNILSENVLNHNIFSIPVDVDSIYEICFRKKYETEIKSFFTTMCLENYIYDYSPDWLNSIFEIHKKEMNDYFNEKFLFQGHLARCNKLVVWWDMYIVDFNSILIWQKEKFSTSNLKNFSEVSANSNEKLASLKSSMYVKFYNINLENCITKNFCSDSKVTWLEWVYNWKEIIIKSCDDFCAWEKEYEYEKIKTLEFYYVGINEINYNYFNLYINSIEIKHKNSFENMFK